MSFPGVGTFQLSSPGSWKICTSFELRLLEVEIGKNEIWRNTYRGVDLITTRFVPGGFFCIHSPPSCTWREVMDGYNRKIWFTKTSSTETFILFRQYLLVLKFNCFAICDTTSERLWDFIPFPSCEPGQQAILTRSFLIPQETALVPTLCQRYFLLVLYCAISVLQSCVAIRMCRAFRNLGATHR